MNVRRLVFQKLCNARDLGGHPTVDGRVTQFGAFIRSAVPAGLPEEDIQALVKYGVTASMDFRSTGEIHSRPSNLAERICYYHKPLYNEAASASGMPKPPKGPIKVDWAAQYVSMAEESREWAIDVLTLAAENEGVLLYHCTTGKDRTGIMTMYLLAIAGVAREDIAADYSVSQIYLEPIYEKMRSGEMFPGNGPAPAFPKEFFETRPEYILHVYDYLTETYGGVVEYLRLIGVPEAVLHKIRQKMVEEG